VLTRQLLEVQGDKSCIFLRTFVIIIHRSQIAVRRIAGGSETRKRNQAALGSIGFVKENDRSMFSEEAMGFTEASLRTLAEQLDLRSSDISNIRNCNLISVLGVLAAPEELEENSVAAIMLCNCPEDFDPLARYAGGGALYWHPLNAQFNDVEIFEPWSRKLLNLGVLRNIHSGIRASTSDRQLA
jgi:hypothetical protein